MCSSSDYKLYIKKHYEYWLKQKLFQMSVLSVTPSIGYYTIYYHTAYTITHSVGNLELISEHQLTSDSYNVIRFLS